MLTTISDVASLAKVSVTTVSRVINNNPHVSAKKRELVLAAMKTLGYSPLQAARQLRGSGSRTIGVTLPHITNPFFSELVAAIQSEAESSQYSTVIYQTNGTEEGELKGLDALKHNQVDGMILCATENEWDIIRPYEKYGVIGVCNEYPADGNVPVVRADQSKGMFDGVSYLLKQGYRKIAFCTGKTRMQVVQNGGDLNSDRYLGFAQALKQNGIQANVDWLFSDVSTVDDGRALLRKIMSMSNPPDAVVTGSDQVAAGMVAEAQKIDVDVPGDVAILGFDDQPISTVLSRPLTTIHQPIKEIGEKITKRVIAALQDGTVDNSEVVLPLHLVVRQSA